MSDDKLYQMSKKNEPTIDSRFGSSYQSTVSHYQYNDRRASSSVQHSNNLFRYSNNARSSTRQTRSQRQGNTSATSVWQKPPSSDIRWLCAERKGFNEYGWVEYYRIDAVPTVTWQDDRQLVGQRDIMETGGWEMF